VIREAVKAKLIAAATVAGSRVYENRMLPWRVAELPAIALYTDEESSQHNDSAPRELERTLSLAIEAGASANDNVDDTLDAFAQQIERAMHADETFSGVCEDSWLAATELVISVDGNRPIAMLRMIYTVRYYTYAPEAADVVLDDLKTTDTKWVDVDGGVDIHAGNQAEDKLEDLDQ
jgi:hypothetical protein